MGGTADRIRALRVANLGGAVAALPWNSAKNARELARVYPFARTTRAARLLRAIDHANELLRKVEHRVGRALPRFLKPSGQHVGGHTCKHCRQWVTGRWVESGYAFSDGEAPRPLSELEPIADRNARRIERLADLHQRLVAARWEEDRNAAEKEKRARARNLKRIARYSMTTAQSDLALTNQLLRQIRRRLNEA